MEYENLIHARKEKGLTQKEMADLLAMEQTTYSKKERGISRIRESEWQSFAKILEKDVDELKRKDKVLATNYNCDHLMYFNIIKIITEYNQILERENHNLKKLLQKLNQKKTERK